MMMVNIKAAMQILKEIKVYTGNTLYNTHHRHCGHVLA